MAAPWVILGRVLRVGFVPGDVEAEEGDQEAQAHPAAPADAHAEEAAEQAEHDAAADAHAEEEAAQVEHAAAAAEPDFTLPVALPPRVTVLAAGRGAHPDPENPDKYPYIVAAGPLSVLVHFAGAPFRGTYFDDYPHESHLVLVRAFVAAGGGGGLTTASAVRVPDRAGPAPVLRNVGSVGLYSDDQGDYRIVELQLHRGGERARLVCFKPAKPTDRRHIPYWYVKDVEHPMAEERREFVPHGAVTVDSTIWWFDLSWGVFSCDLGEDVPDLLFHHVPDGRALAEATTDIHARRCVTVSRNKVRYVEIITAGGATRLCMWTRLIGPDGWTWYVKYAMNFDNVWDDDSYRETGLPREVPVLAAVCPSNPRLVYFALEHRLFGVDVPAHRVVHSEAYELVNIPGPPQPPSSRYVLAWNLPPEVAQALGMDLAGFHAGQMAVEDDDLPEGLADNEGPQAGEIEEEEQPGVADVRGDEDQLEEELDYADPQGAVVLEDLQAARNRDDEQQEQAADAGDVDVLSDDFSEEQMRRVAKIVSVKMDPATLSRLKSDVKEYFRDMEKDQPGPSQGPGDDDAQGPGDDAGESAV